MWCDQWSPICEYRNGSLVESITNMRYGTVWCGMARYGTLWYGMVRYPKALFGTSLSM